MRLNRVYNMLCFKCKNGVDAGTEEGFHEIQDVIPVVNVIHASSSEWHPLIDIIGDMKACYNGTGNVKWKTLQLVM